MSLSRSGRSIVYTNEVPYEADILYSNMYKMVDVSNLAQAVLGGAGTANATLVSGLAATPNATPNLTINIANGVIYTLSALDATDYGVIPADTSDFIYKPFTQVAAAFNLAGFTPPGSGTLNYLVQARGVTQDVDSALRPFFNPANPAAPIFQTVAQTRLDFIQYSLKSATSPSIPTPDPGYVGLYVVSVAAGQTTITAPNITVYSGAPFITESLTQKISTATGDLRYARPVNIQNQQYVYGLATGSANTYAVSLTPTVTSLVAGARFAVKINVANTAASTINVNGLGAVSITLNNGSALSGGEMPANMIAELTYDGAAFQLGNPVQSSIPSGTIIDFGGTTAPSGFLKCDGTEGSGGNVSRTTYAALFAAIGTTWGAGDGSTTFGLPNLSRRTKVGAGGASSGTLGNTVGSIGGTETVTLTTAQVPNLSVQVSTPCRTGASTPPGDVVCATGGIAGTVFSNGATTNGGGGSHNNVQPSGVTLACIKI